MDKYTNFYDLMIKLKSFCEIIHFEALGIKVWISFPLKKNSYSQNRRCGAKKHLILRVNLVIIPVNTPRFNMMGGAEFTNTLHHHYYH